MPNYNAPLRDLRFLYDEVIVGDKMQALPNFAEVDNDTITAILEEANRFCINELLPLNRNADENGCVWDDGQVTTPAGFKEAYKAFCESGFHSIVMDAEHGGQGLPKTLHLMIDEIICATNLSFGLYPGLSNGAYSALEAYASDEIKNVYFPKMAEGTWCATMCLTEPHCGTDLGMLRTKAEPEADGSYAISGTKIFISGGEHDLSDNILHLVLARTPDAPQGIRGISLFLVPKFLPSSDGSLASDINGVRCGSIEEKMGIHGASTCVMNFDGAKGFLIGDLNKGMRAMFKMMNTERVAVGMQGLGIAEAAYQGAVEYARERIQGRSLTGPKNSDKQADPILVHPDVRRMLLTIRANAEACRAFAVWLGLLLDTSSHSADDEQRKEAEELVALLTPIAKALMTDVGFESANLGMQVFGGHGYIREYGMEQLVRDARIAQIYEGTNGIQAMDLVGRKLPAEGGAYMKRFAALVQTFIAEHKADHGEFIEPLEQAGGHLLEATQHLMASAAADPNEVGAAAYDYMTLMGQVVLGLMWAKMAMVAKAKAGQEPYYDTKLKTARFFFSRLLPKTESLLAAVKSGAEPMMAFADDEF